ncbi:motile sperm domain-containing protein 1-like isoform X2 [Lethenteron reissneri]|uniref:motile sperm domain-containing protein 1-like isoform X2 n=1 Tax=Lethenteron reissneri TaxID=7753 RepID=UPI002AB6D637|nr:motile sperm domain-containing protein 1-like isoform X2 [Lethenteron reissneri]
MRRRSLQGRIESLGGGGATRGAGGRVLRSASPEERTSLAAGEGGASVPGGLVLPVFVFPTELSFFADDQRSHKQLLTIYNPYEFPLHFKVLCTAPTRYTVVDAEGTVKEQCCVDITIRHHAASLAEHVGETDKFRLVVYGTSGGAEGRREIVATLHATATQAARGVDDGAMSLPARLERGGASAQRDAGRQKAGERAAAAVREADSIFERAHYTRGVRAGSGASYLVILTGVVCVVALMLPTLGDTGSLLPHYLHLTAHQKLVAAYVLGLVTMLILQA